MTQRYELSDGKATKFFEIELQGTAYTARWGKVGASSRNERRNEFKDAAAAQKAYDKAIAEKLKLGFALVGGGKANAKPEAKPAKPAKAAKPSTPLEDQLAENPDDVAAWQVYADWLLENGEAWGGVIAAACTGKRTKKQQDEAAAEILGGLDSSSVSWKHGTIESIDFYPVNDPAEESEEDDLEPADYPMTKALQRALAHPAGRLVRTLNLGLPPDVDGGISWTFDSLIPVIAKAGPLPLLHTVDMSKRSEHMDQDSWRRIGDLRPLWKAAPRLRTLSMLGANGSDGGKPIVLGAIDAPHLERFVFLSGGLDKSVSLDLGKATLPNLRHLELLFGRDHYGNNHDIKSLAGILSGTGLPKLEYLGLKNSEWEADLIEAIAKSAILPRLKTLDLSMGIFYRDATAALVKHAAKFTHLHALELGENYLLPEHCRQIKKAIACASTSDQRELEDEDESYRFTSMGE
jgi:uncharacterized protein (TIGR02996 family)